MTPEELEKLRLDMIDHLEAALAIADETGDRMVGLLVEQALDQVKADMWPYFVDLKP